MIKKGLSFKKKFLKLEEPQDDPLEASSYSLIQ